MILHSMTIAFLFISDLALSAPAIVPLKTTPNAHQFWADATSIESLGKPRFAKPPRHADDPENPEEALRAVRKRKGEGRETREKRHRKETPKWEQTIGQSLRRETLRRRERQWMIELSAVFPLAVTQGSKSGYTADPSFHFLGLWRRGGSQSDGKRGLFVGIRLAPFAGTGFYKKAPGTFGLLYLGPVIGWGSLDLPEADIGSQTTTVEGGNSPELPSTSGSVWTAGLTVLHRQGFSETADPDDPKNDFSNRRLTFDSPGLFVEYRSLNVLYGGLASNPLGGIQMGKDKIFVYIGLGLGGWH